MDWDGLGLIGIDWDGPGLPAAELADMDSLGLPSSGDAL
eukprot:SAG31_NODE_3790_length_3878_cov_1.766931_2_plen_39_part_00